MHSVSAGKRGHRNGMQKVPASATCRRVLRKASRQCGEEQGEMGCVFRSGLSGMV